MTRSTDKGETPFGEYSGVAFQFAISLLLFVYVGQWLDKKLHTAPWLLIVGVFFGAGLSFFAMYRKLSGIQARDEAARAAERDNRS
jgi:ATP synthase protein I